MSDGLWPDISFQASGIYYRPAGFIVAVEGTMYPGAPAPPVPEINDGTGFWAGFSSGIVGGLTNMSDGLWKSALTGYSAAVIPMGPSVQAGRQATIVLIRQLASWWLAQYGSYDGLAILLTGYSQGAMVTGFVWSQDIWATDGVLHDLLPFVYRVYQFGDPFRTPGIAHGNELAGLPAPPDVDGVTTGGIGGHLDLTVEQTNYQAPDGKPVMCSCANIGDLYTDCPVGDTPQTSVAPAGNAEYLIFNMVQNPSFGSILEIATALKQPIGAIEAVVNGLKFVAVSTAPHMQYYPQMLACINDALVLGQGLQAAA